MEHCCICIIIYLRHKHRLRRIQVNRKARGNFVVYENLEKGAILFKLLSPQGKVLWKYKQEDTKSHYDIHYANGKIYHVTLARQFVLSLYSIEVGGQTTSREIIGSGSQPTQEGVFYNKNEEKSIYFSPYSDLDSEIVYAIPDSRVLSEAHSAGDYHLVVIGHFEGKMLYILHEGNINRADRAARL